MDDLKTYILEELKQSDSKMQKLDDVQLDLVKFYFTTVFSLGTVTIAMINYGIYKNIKVLITWILLLPLFIFGIFIYIVLKNLMLEYDNVEHTRNQAREYFINGSVVNQYKIKQSPLKPFETFISWIIIFNFLFLSYGAIPFLRKLNLSTYVIVIVVLLVASITSAVIVVALRTARLKSRDARRTADIRQVMTALELYYNDIGRYPLVNSWSELATELKNYITILPLDPLNNNEYKYSFEFTENGGSYSMKFKQEEKKQDMEASPQGIKNI